MSCTYLRRVSNPRLYFFTGDFLFPGVEVTSQLTLMLVYTKLKILFKFLSRAGFLARRCCRPIRIILSPFHYQAESRQPDWPWPSSSAACTGNRIQGDILGLPSPHYFNSRSLPSHLNNLSYRLLIYKREGQGCWSPLHPLYILPRHIPILVGLPPPLL